MVKKSGSRKKSGNTLSGDAGDMDRLIAELKNRIAVLENELRLKQEDMTSRDAAERKRAEDALRDNGEKFRQMAENIGEVFFIFTPDWKRTIYVSPAYERVWGRPLNEVYENSMAWLGGVHPDDRGLPLAVVNKHIGGNVSGMNTVEFRVLRPDGAVRGIFARTYPVLDEQGTVCRITGIAEDITDRKRAEELLRENERKFRAIFDQTLQFIGLLATDGTLLEANRAALEFIGAKESDVVGKPFWGTPWWTHSPALQARLRRAVEAAAEGETVRFEATLITKDQHLFYIDFSLKPLTDEDGNIVLLIPEGRDITDRKRAEEELARLASIVTSSNDAIIGKTLDGVITNWNKGAELLYGYSEAEAVGRSIGVIVPPDRKRELQDIMARIRYGERVKRLETERVTKDSRRIDVSITISPIVDASGNVTGASTIARDITERKRTEKDLRLTQFSIDRAADFALWVAPDGRFIYANEAACKAFGYTREEFLSLRAFDTNPYFNEENWGEHWKEVKERGSFTFEARLRKKDGTFFPGEITVNYLVYEGKEYNCSYIRDITQRKQAEQAVTSERQRLFSLLDELPGFVYLQDTDYRIHYANRRFKELFGDPKDVHCYEIFYRYKEPCEECPTLRALETNTPFEWEWTSPAGRTYQLFDYPFKEKDGPPMVLELGIDITERKRAEEALRESEASLAKAQRITHLGNWEWEVKEDKVFCSDELYRVFGLDRRDYITYGQFIDTLCTGDRDRVNRAVEAALYQGEPYNIDYCVIWPDGSEHIIHTEGQVTYGPGGEPVKMFGTVQDITEWKRAEIALKDTLLEASRFRQATENVSAYIYMKDLQSRYIYANKLTLELFGCSAEELIGCDDTRFFPPETVKRLREVDLRVFAGEQTSEEIDVADARSGRRVYLEIKTPIYADLDGKTICGLLGISTDITERKQAEEELKAAKAQAELYLDLMGHDINNLHQVALGYLELARDMPAGEDQTMFLDKPVEVLQRSAKLISNVMKLQKLRDGVFQDQDVDVCKVLSDVQREFGAVPNKKIKLSLNGFERCHVRANELLHDVFSNLVSNAIKHTGDRAAINVDLDIVKDNGGRQYCRVAVEDDGPGIPDEFKTTIFNRALKSDSKAKGMGLGLYLVKSLVHSYGGRVWVEDRVKGDHTEGARFVVMLPAAYN